jgi:hypothetical protein
MSEAAEKTKRELEPDQAEDAAEEQPAAKRAKTDADAAAADAETAGAAEGDAEMADDAEAAAADDAQAEDGEEAAEGDDAAEEQVAAEPVKLGYRTFKSASEASDYIANILKKAKPGENLNEVCSSYLPVCPLDLMYCQQQRLLSHCTAVVSARRMAALYAVAGLFTWRVLLCALVEHRPAVRAHTIQRAAARTGTLKWSTQIVQKTHTDRVLLLSICCCCRSMSCCCCLTYCRKATHGHQKRCGCP